MRSFLDTSIPQDNPLYHDTWALLKRYRDVVWSLELSVQRARRHFMLEVGSSIEDFLESIYLAGVSFVSTDVESHAQSIAQSNKMLALVDSAIDLMRTKHRNGEAYYWILFYTYLSSQQCQNTDEIIDALRSHIRDISYRTYYRKRREAIETLSSVLWGCDCG